MSGDNRSVATDATATLGQLIDESAARDAVHIAVEPVMATREIYPGQSVGLTKAGGAVPVAPGKGVGIADPFLPAEPIKPTQWFWLFVYPRTITSLRHVWAHPDFKETEEAGKAESKPEKIGSKEVAEKWLRDFCKTSDCPDYDTVIAAATGQYVEQHSPEYYGPEAYELQDYGDGDIFLLFKGRDAHSSIPSVFWDHVETVTGKKIPQSKRATHFSCAC